ncbi:MAG: heparinase II/III family protein [Methylobacteriaceae bacterium]|nr:heparinase II/III family protein [Methylobacteriaceae bacterium]
MRERATRFQIWKLACGEAWRAFSAWPGVAFDLRLSPYIPKRMLLAPQDLRTADPTEAHDIYAGYFVFEGHSVHAGGSSPFVAPPPSTAWAEALYGFGWLRHLRAAGTALAQANGRTLVQEFMNGVGFSRAPLANTTPVVSRRLISFICQSPLILDGADHAFYMRFVRVIGVMVKKTRRDALHHPQPYARLQAIIALCYAGLCCEGLEWVFRKAGRWLNRELDRQILPDGGHISRNPGVLIDVLLDLLPLRQVYSSRGIPVPQALQAAIDRMVPMLRMFCFKDGSLAHFNGMGLTATDHMATLLMYDDVRAKPNARAPYSGYIRIEAGETVLIADVGAQPPLSQSRRACAGCLAFELTSGVQPLVVNCGAPLSASPALELAVRSTAAHSTLGVVGDSQAEFLENSHGGLTGLVTGWLIRRIGPVVLSGAESVILEQEDGDQTAHISAAHAAYRKLFGFDHRRSWSLSPEGDILNGEDTLIVAAGRSPAKPLTIRFHLAPTVRTHMDEGGTVVILETGGGERWSFSAAPHAPALEESVFFSAGNGPQATSQIVLEIPPDDARPVAWRFERFRTAALPDDPDDDG